MLMLALAGMSAVLIVRNGITEYGSGLAGSEAPAASDFVEARFSDIYTWSSAANGRPVRIKGRLHRCDGTEQWIRGSDKIEEGELVLYRFVVTCCPGHAVPSVVRIEPRTGFEAVPQDSWVEISGRLEMGRGPEEMPLLNVDSLRQLESAPVPPAEQLNPPSKMGAPCAGRRPDISYPPR